MNVIEIVVSASAASLFCAWLAISMIVYVPSLKNRIRRWDSIGLIPQWNFFAPNPARHDFHLLFRDRLQDGTITEWTEVASIAQRPNWGIVWNPGKRRNKALFDAVTDLAMHVKDSLPALELSIPYLTLLNYVSGLPRFAGESFTQFLIMCSGSSDQGQKPELLYLSKLHSL